jgi:hypothetical protein
VFEAFAGAIALAGCLAFAHQAPPAGPSMQVPVVALEVGQVAPSLAQTLVDRRTHCSRLRCRQPTLWSRFGLAGADGGIGDPL